MTQAALARALDVPQKEVGRYERGEVVPRLERLATVADLVGVDLSELFRAGTIREHRLPEAVAAVADLVQRRALREPGFPARALRVLRAI